MISPDNTGIEGIFYRPGAELNPAQAAEARRLGSAALHDLREAQQGGVVGLSAVDAARAMVAAIHAGTAVEQQPQDLSTMPGTGNLVSFTQPNVAAVRPAENMPSAVPGVIGEGMDTSAVSTTPLPPINGLHL